LCCVTMHDAPSPLEFYPPSMTSYLHLPFFSTFPTSVMLLRGRSISLVGREGCLRYCRERIFCGRFSVS